MSSHFSEPLPERARQFLTTHWSAVIRSRDEQTNATEALGELCESYWYPLYAFVRRAGYNAHDAEDRTQEFFHQFLQEGFLRNVDPAKGKFRSFLLGALKHFLSHERERADAQKRGGGRTIISLDAEAAETRLSFEPSVPPDSQEVFDREWARTLLEQVLQRLRLEYAAGQKRELFVQAKKSLAGEPLDPDELGAALGMSSGAAKVAAHRLRKRYRELLREEIARTVSTPDEIEPELRYLLKALA